MEITDLSYLSISSIERIEFEIRKGGLFILNNDYIDYLKTQENMYKFVRPDELLSEYYSKNTRFNLSEFLKATLWLGVKEIPHPDYPCLIEVKKLPKANVNYYGIL